MVEEVVGHLRRGATRRRGRSRSACRPSASTGIRATTGIGTVDSATGVPAIRLVPRLDPSGTPIRRSRRGGARRRRSQPARCAAVVLARARRRAAACSRRLRAASTCRRPSRAVLRGRLRRTTTKLPKLIGKTVTQQIELVAADRRARAEGHRQATRRRSSTRCERRAVGDKSVVDNPKIETGGRSNVNRRAAGRLRLYKQNSRTARAASERRCSAARRGRRRGRRPRPC